ncbi:MAG: hypothetical protein R3E68_18425 [Burkholderiaceae bacterium]
MPSRPASPTPGCSPAPGRRRRPASSSRRRCARNPDSPAILFSLAQLAYQTDQKPVATKYLEQHAALADTVQRDNNPAHPSGQIAEERKDYKAAVAHYANVGPGEQYLDARIRQAVLTARLGDVPAGQQVLRTTNVDPCVNARAADQRRGRGAAGRRPAGRRLQTADEAIAKQPDNTDLLYDHAMAAERINRLDVLEKSLRAIMSRNRKAPMRSTMRWLYAGRPNQRLAEAQKLIEKALELSPDDPHIIDSLGWVLSPSRRPEGRREGASQGLSRSSEAEIATHLRARSSGRQASATRRAVLRGRGPHRRSRERHVARDPGTPERQPQSGARAINGAARPKRLSRLRKPAPPCWVPDGWRLPGAGPGTGHRR